MDTKIRLCINNHKGCQEASKQTVRGSEWTIAERNGPECGQRELFPGVIDSVLNRGGRNGSGLTDGSSIETPETPLAPS